MFRVTPLLATTLLAAPVAAQDMAPFNPAEQTQTYHIEVTRPGDANSLDATIRDDATPAPDASASMDQGMDPALSSAPEALAQHLDATSDALDGEHTPNTDLSEAKPAPDAAATLDRTTDEAALDRAPVSEPALIEITPASGDGATLPDEVSDLGADLAPTVDLNGAPAAPALMTGDQDTSARGEDDHLQVSLPVAEDVSPEPISPADPAELDALLGHFSQDAKQFTQQDGGALYDATCAACHMPDATGAEGAGAYPPLAGNPKMISPYYIAVVLLTGYHGMPRFGNTMDDAQIAAVTNYVRSHFGNDFEGEITAEAVGQLRAK